MSTNTPYLALALLATGESVGTWGTPLNNNFSKIDILAGEIITARGSEADINERFNTIESEIATARGTLPSLNDRLSVMLQDDGNIRIENMPTSSTADLGVTRLSVNPTTAGMPIAVGTNDSRMLTQGEHDALTGGSNTTLHQHVLATGATDVTATAAEVNQALDGIGGQVTAARLTSLVDGTKINDTYHYHPEAGFGTRGFAQLSVTPVSAALPIAVGDNDTRVLTQTDKNLLTTGGVTTLHGHNLVDGARDLTVTATVLNQLNNAGATVTASNLDLLTNGSDVTDTLHHHDNRYYTQTESDATTSSLQGYADAAVSNHDNNPAAHQNEDLQLGNINVSSLTSSDSGAILTLQADGSDPDATLKFIVKDSSGVNKATINAVGDLVVENLQVNGTSTIVDTETVQNDQIITDDLSVQGDTTLGDNNAVDQLTVNCVTSTFHGDITLNGGLNVTGTVDGVDVSARDIILTNVRDEVVTARDGEVDLDTRLNNADTAATTLTNEVVAARAGEVDLNTRITNVDGDVTSLENEVTAARNGEVDLDTRISNIDADVTALEVEVTAADNSVIYGAFADLDARFENVEGIVSADNAEIIAARGIEVNIDTRLDNIESDVSSNTADVATLQGSNATNTSDISTHTANNSNPHTVTLTQAIAADGGTDITVFQLETLSDGSNADALHTHDQTDNELLAARNSAIYGAYGDIDTRLENSETILNNHNTEIVNARNGEASLDARLDIADTERAQNTSDITTNAGNISTNATNISNNTAAIVTKGYSNTYSANTVFTVTHNLGTKAIIVQVRDTGGDAWVAHTAIAYTSVNEVAVTIGSSLAVEITVIAYTP